MNYTEKSITYFDSDLSKIRARPAMYIGPVDNAGVFTVLREVCDNAVDEARAGRNKLIDITVSKNGEFTGLLLPNMNVCAVKLVSHFDVVLG